MIDRLTLTAFACALLLSAGLLFNIQPMVGKMLLPLVGGTPAVWNVAMAFFQLSLLLGYLIAHVLSKMPAFVHATAYVVGLAVATIFLPIALPADWRPSPDSYEPFQVLSLLVTSIAVPFVALSLSAPTLQRLFAATRHKQASDPYFLYVASNLGSFAGLLIYPLFLEPRFGVSEQAVMWNQVFYGIIALGAICLFIQLLHPSQKTAVAAPVSTSPAPSWFDRGRWVALAAIPSSLTLGVTTYINTDVAPTPMFWVITLGLYLLTYVVAFARRGESVRMANLSYYQWMGCLAVACFLVPLEMPWVIVGINLLAFFMVALACHTRLSQNRPQADRLTEFYFWLSVGGALGGSFNAFLAPVIFSQLFEYPIVMVLGMLAFMPKNTMLDNAKELRFAAIGLILAVMMIVGATLLQWLESVNQIRIFMILFVTVALLLLRANRLSFGAAGIAVILGITLSGLYNNRIYIGRDFFGVISVAETLDAKTNTTYRTLNHGNTAHGMQIVRPNVMNIPTAYYSPLSPIAAAFRLLEPKQVAIMGLGAGGLNCFAKPEQQFHFIEIDPLMIEVAREFFTFITDCPPPKITIGDGRLELIKSTGSYDLIVMDAFSSDSIPVHLVTQDAIKLYLQKLNPGGAIAIHISNRFFDLQPMLAAVAHNLGLAAVRGYSLVSRVEPDTIHAPSEWILMAPDGATLMPFLNDRPAATEGLLTVNPLLVDRARWEPAQRRDGVRAWTDEYSNMLAVLKWKPHVNPSSPPPTQP